MDPAFDDAGFIERLRRRVRAIKRALLDQSLISGVGNIYADEALWRARLHGERSTATLTRPSCAPAARPRSARCSTDAIAAGGTSFDALYVNVNGESGYFDRTLNVYGREGQPCPPMRHDRSAETAFMNRSSFFCPRCQRIPEAATGSRRMHAVRLIEVQLYVRHPVVDQPLPECDHEVT